MKDFYISSFGELNAEGYDLELDPGTTAECVELLYKLINENKPGGQTLELAIGTGRVALPLKARGVDISGIEASTDMVAKLREKPGGDLLPVTIGDMADVDVEATFDCVFLIFNTLFNLTSQEAQLRCFQNVGLHLNPGGIFIVETFIPSVLGLQDLGNTRTRSVDFNSVVLEAAEHNPLEQRVDFQRIHITASGTKLTPLPIRYAWPSELDLMAKLAALERVNRFGSWHGTPFTEDSDMHISVYQKQ